MVVGVRSSKYRHVYGDPTRKDRCFDNIRLTTNAFDADLAQSNGKYVSLNWDASGGGSFAVFPVKEQGKVPDRFPLFDGHKGPVLDTEWNPFDEDMVVSASDDGTIGVWRVPQDFSVHKEYKLDDTPDVKPEKFLKGHGKKVGHLKFNPVAENVLASASLDNTVKIWDIATGEVLFTLKHPAFVTSFDWNYNGTKIATVAKDKNLRIWDVRNEKIISEGRGHSGAKGSRVVWLGDNDRVLTTGFSLISDREMAIWDINDIPKGPVGGFRPLDPSSGIVIPHYDPMTSMVYLGGRGDGKIVYYEYADDTLYDLFAYNSNLPQRGLGWIPNRALDQENHEVARCYKVHEKLVEPISFRVPLRNDGFLDSVYTFVESGEPALSADEWKSGKNARPLVRWWQDIYNGKDSKSFPAPASESKTEKTESTKEPAKEPKTEAKEAKTESKEAEIESKEAKTGPTKETTKEATKEAKEPTKEPTKVAKTEATKPEPTKKPTSEEAVKNEEIAALSKAEKQDGYDILDSKEVESFLAKNSEKDEEVEEEEEDSAWNDEPVEKEELTAGPLKAKETPKEARKAEEAKEPPKEAKETKEPKESKKEEPKAAETKKEPAEIKKEPAETKKEPASETNKAPKEVAKPEVSKLATVGEKLNLILEKMDLLHERITALENKSS